MSIGNVVLCTFSFTLACIAVKARIYNPHTYGAVGDGKANDTQAFIRCWQAACSGSWASASTFQLTRLKTYNIMSPVTFQGPCQGPVTMDWQASIVTPPSMEMWGPTTRWISFSYVQRLSINGSDIGVINGNGHNWWQCLRTNKCSKAPTTLTVANCKNVSIAGLRILNSPGIHVSIHGCRRLHVQNMMLTSPADSPNTDGYHVSHSSHVTITNCTARTGDDCVSIANESHNIKIRNMTCGPGHGISIGSLGENGSHANVSDIHVNGAWICNTTNGVRIKTWQGGKGTAKNIAFSNMEMDNVEYPIRIDQFYCNKASSGTCGISKMAVAISNVSYINIKGTSATRAAIALNCSDTVPCTRLKFEGINLTYIIMDGSADVATMFCNNARGTVVGTNNAPDPAINCLNHDDLDDYNKSCLAGPQMRPPSLPCAPLLGLQISASRNSNSHSPSSIS